MSISAMTNYSFGTLDSALGPSFKQSNFLKSSLPLSTARQQAATVLKVIMFALKLMLVLSRDFFCKKMNCNSLKFLQF